MRGDSGVAGEGRVVGVPKFHSWGKCTMPLRLRDMVCSLIFMKNITFLFFVQEPVYSTQ